MKIISLTNTFPPDVLPVRSGVYMTRPVDENGANTDDQWGFSFFDATDRIWGCSYSDRDNAWKHPEFEFAHQQKEWQGLAVETKA